MGTGVGSKLERRVVEAADEALGRQQYVSAIDVLVGVRWLAPSNVDRWRQGRVDCLERIAQVDPSKLSDAMAIFRRWAADRELVPSETAYVARTRDRRALRFSAHGDEAIEQAYRTHWVSPALSEAQRDRLTDRQSKAPDLVVISPLKDWRCTSCEGTGDLLIMEEPGRLCLRCADLDHLVYLPAGDATLTRRAKKASRLAAVVVRFSRSRKRYERQGVLVEEAALIQAEQDCLADEDARSRRRERAEETRAQQDVELQRALSEAILELFPSCPTDRATAIAQHAGTRGSGRVGRTTAGKALDSDAVTAAVVASVRHVDTTYDELLMTGVPRDEARQLVNQDVQDLLADWRRDAT